MYAEILREREEPELGLMICARDDPWVKSFNPGLGFHRTKTLMEDNDACDHVFYVERLLDIGCDGACLGQWAAVVTAPGCA
jgi:hypothetical protein